MRSAEWAIGHWLSAIGYRAKESAECGMGDWPLAIGYWLLPKADCRFKAESLRPSRRFFLHCEHPPRAKAGAI
jgi:hypothetical protein